jgi:glycosyl transferase family 25
VYSTPVKIFVINLERSEERRMVIESKLTALDLSFEIFPAVDGANIPDEVMQQVHQNGRKFREMYGQDMGRGEAGAAFSHRGVYKKILQQGLPAAIVLEDDVEFDDRLKHIVYKPAKVEKILHVFDLVLLGYCRDDLDYLKPADCSYWGRKKLDNIIDVGIPVHWYWAAIGYLISREGAKKLLATEDRIFMQADYLTANSPFYNVKLGTIKKPVVWPGPLNELSTIRLSSNHPGENKTPLQPGSDKTSGLNFTGPLKISYRAIRDFCQSFREKMNVFLLKVSPKQNQFIDQHTWEHGKSVNEHENV